MESDKSIPSNNSLQNIEKAIKEYGTIACPSPRCNDKLISQEKWEQEHGKVIVYQCQNSTCAHHIPRQIFIENESNHIIITHDKTAPDKATSNKLSNNNIFTFLGICLFAILFYTSYHFFYDNQKPDKGLTGKGASSGQQNYSPKHDDHKINRKPLLKSKVIIANNPLEESEKLNINEFVEQSRTWVEAGNFEKGKLKIKKLLENERYQSALLLPENNLTRYQLIELVGYSYEKNKNRFTYKLLHQISDFEILKKFIEIYDVEKKYTDVYLGRAYFYLPNKLKNKVSWNERKKMQMTSLMHYLQAAKNNNFAGQKLRSIKKINELSLAYSIFKYNTIKPDNFKTIEKLIESKDTLEIQNRIDYINQIIEKLS
jgi:hypothetical protein